MACSISAAYELVVDVEVAHLVAVAVGVDLLEHRLEVEVEAAVAALVHYPRRRRRTRPAVRHLRTCMLAVNLLIY